VKPLGVRIIAMPRPWASSTTVCIARAARSLMSAPIRSD
jgi:hypothetical protein